MCHVDIPCSTFVLSATSLLIYQLMDGDVWSLASHCPNNASWCRNLADKLFIFQCILFFHVIHIIMLFDRLQIMPSKNLYLSSTYSRVFEVDLTFSNVFLSVCIHLISHPHQLSRPHKR